MFRAIKDPEARETAAGTFVTVCEWIPATEAEPLLREAIREATGERERRGLEYGLAICRENPDTLGGCVEMANSLADECNYTPAWFTDRSLRPFSALVCGFTREQYDRRNALPALAGGVVSPDTLPKPKPLPPQVLVDLLKRPFVVRERRRAVLNALEFTYDRKFKDLWEFVTFAEKEHPELDLLTPPKRPEKK